MITLNKTDFIALRWAITRAGEWRGSLVGNPDPFPLRKFDARMNQARKALEKIYHGYPTV